MTRRDAVLLALLFALAFALRFEGVATPAQRWGDELVHVPAAVNYWERGHFDPNLWEHPPLRHVLLLPFLRVFGDNPYGWRLRNVLLGAATAVLVALLAHAIDGSRFTAGVAGLLLATDPLHVALSRFTFEEIYGVAFFVGALVLWLRARGRVAWLLASALLMGCALATKWYYVPVWLLVTALTLAEDGRWRRAADAALVLSAFLLVPATVYVLSYLPWFGRGYSFAELLELTANAYASLQHYGAQVFNGYYPYLRPTRPLEWFVSPVMFGAPAPGVPPGRWLVFGNDVAVWGLTLPAMGVCAAVAARRRSIRWAIPVLFFAATYAVPLLASRPACVYSAIPLLPFAFCAVALALSRAADRLGRRAAWTVAGLMVAANLFLYPLATGRAVPARLYDPVLAIVDLGSG